MGDKVKHLELELKISAGLLVGSRALEVESEDSDWDYVFSVENGQDILEEVLALGITPKTYIGQNYDYPAEELGEYADIRQYNLVHWPKLTFIAIFTLNNAKYNLFLVQESELGHYKRAIALASLFAHTAQDKRARIDLWRTCLRATTL